MKLTYKQTRAKQLLENKDIRELIFGGGAGGGKSAFGCFWLIKNCLKYPGTRWVMGRAKLKTLTTTTLKTFFEIAKIQGLIINYHFHFNSQKGVITFFNESEILLMDLFYFPSDPNFDRLGSLELTGAFVDEVNEIRFTAWEVLMSRIRFKLDKYNLQPKLLGTCNPSKNWVYGYYKIGENKIKDGKCFIQSLAGENEHLSSFYTENLLRLSEVYKQRLLYGNWEYDDDPTKIFEYKNLQNAFSNDFIIPDEKKKYMSADIALQGSDKFVISIWNGFVVEKIVSIAKCDGEEAVDKIKSLARKYKVPVSNIVYDHDGIGAFIGSYVKGSKSFVNNSRALNEENYGNLKSQCFFKLAEKINNNEIYIKDDRYKDEIIQELEQIRELNQDKDGKISVEGKEKVKEAINRSPDFADSLMMRMIFEVERKQFIGIISV